MSQQLKDKRNEIKKLEKKVKSENQATQASEEMVEKIEKLEKEAKESQKKYHDDCKKLQRELQKITEARDSLREELNYATAEIDRYIYIKDLKGSLKKRCTFCKNNLTEFSCL